MGREKIIELPKNWYEDNNFLGFALFFYLVPLYDDDPMCKMIYGWPFIPDSLIQFGISNGDEIESVDIYIVSHNKLYLKQFLEHENFTISSLDPALQVVYFSQISIATEYQSNWWNKIKARFEGPFECGMLGPDQSYGITNRIFRYCFLWVKDKPQVL